MKVGAPTSSPRMRAATKCPISCTRISSTKPTAYHHPKMNAYTTIEISIVPALSATLPSLPAARSPARSFSMSGRRRRHLWRFRLPEELHRNGANRHQREHDHLGELDEERGDERKEAELLRGDAAHERGEAVLRDPIGRRVEVAIGLAFVEFQRRQQKPRGRLLRLDQVEAADEVHADVALAPEEICVVVHTLSVTPGRSLLARRKRPDQPMCRRLVARALDPSDDLDLGNAALLALDIRFARALLDAGEELVGLPIPGVVVLDEARRDVPHGDEPVFLRERKDRADEIRPRPVAHRAQDLHRFALRNEDEALRQVEGGLVDDLHVGGTFLRDVARGGEGGRDRALGIRCRRLCECSRGEERGEKQYDISHDCSLSPLATAYTLK